MFVLDRERKRVHASQQWYNRYPKPVEKRDDDVLIPKSSLTPQQVAPEIDWNKTLDEVDREGRVEFRRQSDGEEEWWIVKKLFDPDIRKSIGYIVFVKDMTSLVELLTTEGDQRVSVEMERRVSSEARERHERRRSMIDDLTGLYNRRYFDRISGQEISNASLHKHPLSMMVIDADHFKRVNDTYGHLTGDEVLKDLAHIITKSIRRHDHLTRWGGEEFVVLIPNTEVDTVLEVAERIRIAVQRHKFTSVDAMTISIGVTTYHAGEKDIDFFDRTDRALYKAKDEGRNRVVYMP